MTGFLAGAAWPSGERRVGKEREGKQEEKKEGREGRERRPDGSERRKWEKEVGKGSGGRT